MDAREMLFTRRSIRKYSAQPVSPEVLQEVFAGAMMAPTWKNTQTAGYIVVQSPEMREKLLAALPEFNARTAMTAPVIVVMTTLHGRSGFDRDGGYSTNKEDRWEYFDAGIACQTLCLSAWEQGLGTCIMGLYDENILRQVLSIPRDTVITAVIPMGYPAISPEAPKRKTVEEKVQYV